MRARRRRVGRDHAGPADELRRALSGIGAALVYLVPTCHNPTGSVMHERRRRELLAVCAEHDATIVEDETCAELTSTATPRLGWASSTPERVISVGSFSKLLWGGLRVGWIRATRRPLCVSAGSRPRRTWATACSTSLRS